MHGRKTQDASVYESLSDIVLATMGIFMILFVINVIFLNADILEISATSTRLKADVSSSEATLNEKKRLHKMTVDKFVEKKEAQIKDLQEKIGNVNAEVRQYRSEIGNKKELLVAFDSPSILLVNPDKISERIKSISEEARFFVDQKQEILENYKQSWNEFVESETKEIKRKPRLEISTGMNQTIVLDHQTPIGKEQFEAILESIEAGSGFAITMAEKKVHNEKSGKQEWVAPPAPEWLSRIIAEKGWPPILSKVD